jgi:hypothetical protein
LGIFITRASGSVALTRGWRLRTCWPRRFGLLLFQLRQLRHGLLQPRELVGRGTLARRMLPRRQRRVLRRIHLRAQLLHMLPGLFEQTLETFFAAETARPRPDSDPHSVLAHAAYMHHLFVHQRRDHLGEQLVQSRGVTGAEVRKQAVVHRHSAAQPAEWRALPAPPRQLPRRADAANARVKPQPHQQSRIGRVTAGRSSARSDRLLESGQVQLLHHRRHQAHAVVRAHQIVRTLRHPRHLTTLRNTQSYRRNTPLRTHFAHLLLIEWIDHEIPKYIARRT